jgi:hypothetical protein
MTSHDHISHGSPAALREFIAENIFLAGMQTELICTYASLGDDKGMEYALRRFTAYAKAALSTLSELKEAVSEQKGGM